jgi:hypothetical protein
VDSHEELLLGMATMVVLAIVGSAWWVHHSLDSPIASSIRRYGPEITGVPIRIFGAHIALTDGTAALRGLVVGNPRGFKTKQALSLGTISMTSTSGRSRRQDHS